MLKEKPFFPMQPGYLHRAQEAENNSIKRQRKERKKGKTSFILPENR